MRRSEKWRGGKEGFGIGIGDLDRAVKGKGGGEKANGTSRRQRGERGCWPERKQTRLRQREGQKQWADKGPRAAKKSACNKTRGNEGGGK